MRSKNVEIGIAVLLIILGAGGILSQVFHIKWPGYISFGDLGILALGLIFEWSYFEKRKAPGLLVPGGILTVVGLFDFLEAFFGGYIFSDFPSGELGVALGLFQLFWFGKRNKWLLVPVVIMLVSALDDITFGLFKWFNASLIWPVLLVILGICLIADHKEQE